MDSTQNTNKGWHPYYSNREIMVIMTSAMAILSIGLALISWELPFTGASLLGLLAAGNVTTTWHVAQHRMHAWYGDSWRAAAPRLLVLNAVDHERHHEAEINWANAEGPTRINDWQRAAHRITPMWLHAVTTAHTIMLGMPFAALMLAQNMLTVRIVLGYVAGAVIWRVCYELGHWLTHATHLHTGLLGALYRAVLHPDLHMRHHTHCNERYAIFRPFAVSEMVLVDHRARPLAITVFSILEEELFRLNPKWRTRVNEKIKASNQMLASIY